LNRTFVVPVKFDPLICTLLPTGPLVGVKLVIVGPPAGVGVGVLVGVGVFVGVMVGVFVIVGTPWTICLNVPLLEAKSVSEL
jgi:hypothetical protein